MNWENEFRENAWLPLAVIILCLLIMALTLTSCDFAFAETVNMNIIAEIESSGNTFAYNETSEARGLYQITPICLKEYNNYHKNEMFKPCDMFDPSRSFIVANWYINKRIPQMLRYYNIEDTIRNRLIAYHDGIGNLQKYLKGERKLGKEMQNYLQKYNNLFDK